MLLAIESIIQLLKKGDLIILESTSPIGTTDLIHKKIIKSRPDLKNNFYLAYCPERVLPGNIMNELVNNDRVIGGINNESTNKAISFYKKYVKGKLHSTNARTAEMCKLVENSSRDVQIAFANELSLICDKANINVWELIKLANKHPRVNILNPGCGVGGHCIAVDPYFIISDFPKESKIIKTARNVNNFKPLWCSEKIENEKLNFKLKYGKDATIALLGLAFKPNIDDLRESPAIEIVDEFIKKSNQNDKFYIVEPNIIHHNKYKLSKYKNAIKKADLIFILVDHKEFKNIKINKKQKLINFASEIIV